MVRAEHEELGRRWLYCAGEAPVLFTENETNNQRIFGTANGSPYVKDGIDRYLVHGETGAVNPDRTGTKAAAHHVLACPAVPRRRRQQRPSTCIDHCGRMLGGDGGWAIVDIHQTGGGRYQTTIFSRVAGLDNAGEVFETRR